MRPELAEVDVLVQGVDLRIAVGGLVQSLDRGVQHPGAGPLGAGVGVLVVVLGGGHVVVALAVALGRQALVAAPRIGLGIVEPEGDVDALQLSDVVLALERTG